LTETGDKDVDAFCLSDIVAALVSAKLSHA
jgi:hypothetical protein